MERAKGLVTSQIRILKKEPRKRTEQDLSCLRESLQDNQFIQKLDRCTVDEICKAMYPQRFLAGSSVFEEGDPGNEFFVILDGTVNVMVSVASGDQDFLSPVATLGDAALKKQQASVEAADNAQKEDQVEKRLNSGPLANTFEDDDPADLAVLSERRRRLKAQRIVKLLGLDTAVAEKGGWTSAFKDDFGSNSRERQAPGHEWSLKPRDADLTSHACLVMLAEEPKRHIETGKWTEAVQEEERTDMLFSTEEAKETDWQQEQLQVEEDICEADDEDLEQRSCESESSEQEEADTLEPPPQHTKSFTSILTRAGTKKTTMKRAMLQTVATLRYPASFGETALQAEVPRTATVKVEEDCWLAVLRAEDYNRILTTFVKKARADKLNFASRSPVLCTLPPHALPQMTSLLREIEVSQNRAVCEIGQPIVDVYFMVEGSFSVSVQLSGDSSSGKHSQDHIIVSSIREHAETVLVEAPEVFGLGAFLRGDRTHSESLTCRSATGRLYAVAAKNLLALLSTELKAALIGLAMTQQSFHNARAAALLKLGPQLVPRSELSRSPKKSSHVYSPHGRLKAMQSGLSGLGSEASHSLSKCWSSPTLRTFASSRRKIKMEEMPPMVAAESVSIESSASLRRLHPSLQHRWSQSALAVVRQMRRAQSLGVLHLMGPPLEVNSFFLGSLAQADADGDFPISTAASNSVADPAITRDMKASLLSNSPKKETKTKRRPSLLLPGDLSDEILQLNQELAKMGIAAVKIQARLRGRQSRIELAMKKEEQAATKIQSLIRAKLARRCLSAALQLRKQQEEKKNKRMLVEEEPDVASARLQKSQEPDSAGRKVAKGTTIELQVDLAGSEELRFRSRRQSGYLRGAELDYDGENLDMLKQALSFRGSASRSTRNSLHRGSISTSSRRSSMISLRRACTLESRRSSITARRSSNFIMFKSGDAEQQRQEAPKLAAEESKLAYAVLPLAPEVEESARRQSLARQSLLANAEAETPRRASRASSVQLPKIQQASRTLAADLDDVNGHTRRLLVVTQEDEEEAAHLTGAFKEEAAEVEEDLVHADALSALTESSDSAEKDVKEVEEDVTIQEQGQATREEAQELREPAPGFEAETFFSTTLTATPPSGKGQGFRRWLMEKQGVSKPLLRVKQTQKIVRKKQSDGIYVHLDEIYALLPARR